MGRSSPHLIRRLRQAEDCQPWSILNDSRPSTYSDSLSWFSSASWADSHYWLYRLGWHPTDLWRHSPLSRRHVLTYGRCLEQDRPWLDCLLPFHPGCHLGPLRQSMIPAQGFGAFDFIHPKLITVDDLSSVLEIQFAEGKRGRWCNVEVRLGAHVGRYADMPRVMRCGSMGWLGRQTTGRLWGHGDIYWRRNIVSCPPSTMTVTEAHEHR